MADVKVHINCWEDECRACKFIITESYGCKCKLWNCGLVELDSGSLQRLQICIDNEVKED